MNSYTYLVNFWWHKPYSVPSKSLPFHLIIYFICQGCIWVHKVQNIFVECTVKCSKALSVYKLHTEKSLEALKTICSLWMTYKIILFKLTSGGCKVVPHNSVPQGNAWCIFWLSLLTNIKNFWWIDPSIPHLFALYWCISKCLLYYTVVTLSRKAILYYKIQWDMAILWQLRGLFDIFTLLSNNCHIVP